MLTTTTAIEPLPMVLKRQGKTLRQLQRNPKAAIYQDERGGFEVIRVRPCKERQAVGRAFPAQEVYPSSERWGIDGWTYLASDERGARNRFATIS